MTPYHSFGHFISSEIAREGPPDDITQSPPSHLAISLRTLGAEPGCQPFYVDWFEKLRSSGSGLRSRREIFTEIVLDANLPRQTKQVLITSFMDEHEAPKDQPPATEPPVDQPSIARPSEAEQSVDESEEGFPKFSSLPAELRIMIWRFATAPRPPRFVHVLHMVDWEMEDETTEDGIFTATTHRRMLKPWDVKGVSQ